MIGTHLGPYEIVAKLGAGGMGEVYRARDPRLERDVAIKLLPDDLAADPERIARFEREAKLLAQLNHNNIATIFGLDEDAGRRFIVMELVDGVSLADRIAGNSAAGTEPGAGLAAGRIPIDDALEIARQIANALEAAHANGVIHRDLKPANIMLTESGRVKVLDFGLAKAYQADGSGSGIGLETSPDISNSPTNMNATRTGVIMGTAAYMSPEQASGTAVDQRTDIWAFGVVLYEMLSGRRLFEGETAAHVLADVLKTEPDLERLPATTPGSIRRLLRRCLQKKTDRRLHHIADARLEIDEAVGPDGETESAVHEGLGGPTSERPLGRRLLPWGVAAAALVVATVAVLGGINRDPPLARRSVEIVIEGMRGVGSISPDGSKIAYVNGGNVVVYDLETGTSTTAVEAADQRRLIDAVVWSPDSSKVSWASFGPAESLPRLVVSPASGGLGREVASFDDPGDYPTDDIAWLNDRSLVGSTGRKLEVFDTEGGGSEVLFELPASADDDTFIRHPLPLPDGSLLYIERGALDAPIRVMRLDGGTAELVRELRPMFVSKWAFADGRVILATRDPVRPPEIGGDVLVMPYDLASGTSAGSSFRLAPDARDFTVSANGTLIYSLSPPTQIDRRAEVVRVDRAGEIIETIDSFEGGWAWTPELSPDGSKLALVSTTGGLDGYAWIYEAGGGAPIRLPGETATMIIGWLPDGRRLAVGRQIEDSSRDRLSIEDTSGEGPARVVAEGASFSLSPDGSHVLYGDGAPRAGGAAMLLNLRADGSADPPTRFPVQTSYNRFEVSPNGRWMAYTDRNVATETTEIWLASFPDGASPRRIAEGSRILWSKGGDEIFFVGRPDGVSSLMTIPIDVARGAPTGPPEALFALDVDDDGGTLIPATTGRGAGFDVSNDGETFVVVRGFFQSRPRARLILVQNWPEVLLDDQATGR